LTTPYLPFLSLFLPSLPCSVHQTFPPYHSPWVFTNDQPRSLGVGQLTTPSWVSLPMSNVFANEHLTFLPFNFGVC
jgi:hypothetical protein